MTGARSPANAGMRVVVGEREVALVFLGEVQGKYGVQAVQDSADLVGVFAFQTSPVDVVEHSTEAVSITVMIAPAKSSPTARAPTRATRAITSAPTRRARMTSITDRSTGKIPSTVVASQTARAACSAPTHELVSPAANPRTPRRATRARHEPKR